MTSLAMQCSLDDMIDVAQESRLSRATAAAAVSVTPSPTGFIEDEQEEDDEEQEEDVFSSRSQLDRPLKKCKYFK